MNPENPQCPYSNPTHIATVEQYKAALLAVRNQGGIWGKPLEMLKAHFQAPLHTTSSTALAKELSWTSFSVVNLHYGTLASNIAHALHVTLPPAPDGNPHWWRTLAYGNSGEPQGDDGCYEWVMRPELVEALQEMRWV